MHVPPFSQGELWHSLISTAQRAPVNPDRQLQWKEFTSSMQDPPFRHGSVGTKDEKKVLVQQETWSFATEKGTFVII